MHHYIIDYLVRQQRFTKYNENRLHHIFYEILDLEI